MRASRAPLPMLVALVMVLAIALPADAGLGWPQDGYDSGHSNANTQEWRLRPDTIGRLRLLWSRSVRPAGITADEFLFEWVDLPVVRGAAFVSWFGQEVDAPRVRALDPATGTLLWSRSSQWSVAAASTDIAYANAERRIVAMDVRSGERRWSRWGREVLAAAPAIDCLVVKTPDGPGLIDAATGQDLWVRTRLQMGTGLSAGEKVVVSQIRPGPDAIVALDMETGNTIWKLPARWAHGRWVSPDAAASGTVFVVTWARSSDARGEVRALRLEDGTTMWRRTLRDATPVVAAVGRGRVFLTRARYTTPGGCEGDAPCPMRGALLALDARTGRTLWRVPGGSGTRRPLLNVGALANGLLFAFGDGLLALSPVAGRVLWRDELDARVAAVADGRVFAVRGGRLWAFGLPDRGGG